MKYKIHKIQNNITGNTYSSLNVFSVSCGNGDGLLWLTELAQTGAVWVFNFTSPSTTQAMTAIGYLCDPNNVTPPTNYTDCDPGNLFYDTSTNSLWVSDTFEFIRY